jgi:sugar fermentation stimulation protein A
VAAFLWVQPPVISLRRRSSRYNGAMRFPPLHEGTLRRRYKRFLADVELADGRQIVAHCPNSGRMTSCLVPGGRVLLSHHDNPRRKLKWTWEVAFGGEDGEQAILVNTARPNHVVKEAILTGIIPTLAGYPTLRSEVRYGANSRVDLLLEGHPDRPPCWVEVKNVTLALGGRSGAFPDAVSARATKHAEELAERVRAGDRAVLFFLVSRGDIDVIRPADEVDPVYGAALRAAAQAGVEVMAWRGAVSKTEIRVTDTLAVDLRATPRR